MIHPGEALSAYLDGELMQVESRRVASHLGACHRCRRRLSELNQARMAVRGLPLIEMPAGLLAGSEGMAPRRRRRPILLGAAAAVAAAVVVASAVLSPPPEPIDLAEVSRQIGARASFDAGAAPLNLIVPDVGVRE